MKKFYFLIIIFIIFLFIFNINNILLLKDARLNNTPNKNISNLYLIKRNDK